MEKINSEDEENKRVINRTLNECIEIVDSNSIEPKNIAMMNRGFQKPMFFGFKTWLSNAKDIVKFNIFSFLILISQMETNDSLKMK